LFVYNAMFNLNYLFQSVVRSAPLALNVLKILLRVNKGYINIFIEYF